MFLYERAYDTVGTSLVDVSVGLVTQTENGHNEFARELRVYPDRRHEFEISLNLPSYKPKKP